MIICDRCDKEMTADHTEEQCLENRWKRICPPLYRESDESLLNQSVLAQARQWSCGGKGLMLYGPTRRGKTRIMFSILKAWHMKGKRISTFDCVSFGHMCASHFLEGNGEHWIARMVRKDIIFFDDIDKAKFTERVETELMGLIEKRIAWMKPIMVTTQLAGDNLVDKFRDASRGEAIVSRLREFCTAIAC